MKRQSMQLFSTLALAAAMLFSAGCQAGRTQEERDALWVQNQELQEQLSQARAALDAAESDRRRLSSEMERLRAEREAQPDVQPQPQSGFQDIEGVETIQEFDRITVRVPGDVLFAPGEVELRSESRQTLAEIASVLQSEHAGNTIRVEGHTDTDPIQQSPWDDNLELSVQRAASVHRYLEEQGIDPDRMYAAGWGEHRPRETKELSRRVEIVVELFD